MSIEERLLSDMKQAQKAGDKARLAAIRWIRDAIQKRAKEEQKELSDDEVLAVLSNLKKRYTDSIEQARKADREKIAHHEESELKILEGYLPSQLSREDIIKLVEETISETGAAGPKDMGNVMKVLKPKWAGRADGKLVSDLVREKLTPKN